MTEENEINLNGYHHMTTCPCAEMAPPALEGYEPVTPKTCRVDWNPIERGWLSGAAAARRLAHWGQEPMPMR